MSVVVVDRNARELDQLAQAVLTQGFGEVVREAVEDDPALLVGVHESSRPQQAKSVDPLASARIYLAAGFELVDEDPHHSFGVDLIDQNYRLSLR